MPVSVMSTRTRRASSDESLTVRRPPLPRPSIACTPLMIRFVKSERKDSASPTTRGTSVSCSTRVSMSPSAACPSTIRSASSIVSRKFSRLIFNSAGRE